MKLYSNGIKIWFVVIMYNDKELYRNNDVFRVCVFWICFIIVVSLVLLVIYFSYDFFLLVFFIRLM